MSTPYAKLPAWADYGLIPVINLFVAFVVAGLVVLLVGENPLRAAAILFQGAFGSGQNIAFTLFYATNFIFTGLAVAVAFHCGLFNIGGEGQAYIAGLGVSVVALTFDSMLPWWLVFPLAIVGAALVGALWALIPAYLQAKRGSHIVITTIMFNFIAASIMVYLLVDVLKPAARWRRRRAPSSKAGNCRSSVGCWRRSAFPSALRRSTSPSCWLWSWPGWSGC